VRHHFTGKGIHLDSSFAQHHDSMMTIEYRTVRSGLQGSRPAGSSDSIYLENVPDWLSTA
jgi:hypothetical protein